MDNTKQMITVAGVTFSAEDLVSAVVKIDGRKITIAEKDDEKEEKRIGFTT